jgi:hypothetical protein
MCEHGHGHVHAAHPLERITHVHGGPSVLDIGGDVGAMVVTLDPSAAGTELFVRNEADGSSVHTGVWTRSLGGATVTAAVFCELREGSYTMLHPHGGDDRPVEITGGLVTELDLR